ncbi:MAG: hypothetical protein KA998_02330 [Rickettsiaceae bacterium]|nr:hypothetical protein [Rickettsiaceae bacterium]
MPYKTDKKKTLVQSAEFSELVYDISTKKEELKNILKSNDENIPIYESKNIEDISSVVKKAKRNNGLAIIYSSKLPKKFAGKTSPKSRLESVVVIDTTKKKVTVITSGTRMDHDIKTAISDVKDDFLLTIGEEPKKLAPLKALNDIIIDQLNGELFDYKFNYTGHSLGGALSDCAATDMAIKLQNRGELTKNKISTATFDNPGAYTRVVKQLESAYKDRKEYERIEHYKAVKKIKHTKFLDNASIKKLLRTEENIYREKINKLEGIYEIDNFRRLVDYKSFNNRPNAINTMDEQVGRKFTIVHKDQKDPNLFYTFIAYIAEELPNCFVKKWLYKFSFGPLGTQISEHKMANFIDVLKDRKGKILYEDEDGKHQTTLRDIAHGTTLIEYDESLFKLIRTTKKRKGEKAEYSMIKEKNKKRYRIEFSKEQLERAKSELEIKKSGKDIKDYISNTSSNTSAHRKKPPKQREAKSI